MEGKERKENAREMQSKERATTGTVTDMDKRMDLIDADTKEELEKVVADTWAATSKEYCSALARSMPARIQQVIDRNGAYTDY